MTLNGTPIIAHDTDSQVVYVRIPRNLAKPCPGCSCPYCKTHPSEISSFDTLAVPYGSAARPQTAWTVHMPDPDAFESSLRLNRAPKGRKTTLTR